MRPHFLSAAQPHVNHRKCVNNGFQGLVSQITSRLTPSRALAEGISLPLRV